MKESQLKFLADAGTYLGKKIHGSVEETHISWVILTGRFAFKIKKPLKFSFLDFSSLAKRKKYCEKEVVLNRRFSEIYIGVVPVRKRGEDWRLGKGPGNIVDYAVQMKRMQSSKRMDFLLQGRKVTIPSILSLARMIGDFHAKAEIIATPFNVDFSRKAFNDIRFIGNFVWEEFPEYSAIVSRSVQWSDSFLRKHTDRFRERISGGFRRDVHGDLHSGNIFLYRRPVIFDCIEFNDAYRHIDVLDEIAFFCMDLEANDQKGLSRKFLVEYAHRFACFQNEEDKGIFNYFKCYRANVRAKVHALAAKQETDPGIRSRHVAWVGKYLLLMAEYMGESVMGLKGMRHQKGLRAKSIPSNP